MLHTSLSLNLAPDTSVRMGDGLNHARAMRVAEIMSDFRNLQYYIAAIQPDPPAEDYYLDGYTVIRACIAEGQKVLETDYSHDAIDPRGDPEAEKAQLKLILLDASIRRFLCQRAYMRASLAQQWAAARTQILGRERPNARNTQQLQQLDLELRHQIDGLSDAHVEHTLRSHDVAQGKYLQDDPPLQVILQEIHRR